MATTVNKRAQARNERALEDIIRSVPGNDRCADCAARNPGWASWSLGIFLCMRCAALHRKLGVHISKVKSLSMDTWTGDQVEQMRRTGNVVSNKAFNPRGTRPNLPLDADEIDTAMEKFIRAKYQTRTLATPAVQAPYQTSSPSSLRRTDTGSTESSDDRPPQVPAKDTPRFGSGFRAASSTLPLGRRERPLPPVRQSQAIDAGRPPDDEALGLSAQEEGMRRLKNMGFANEKKNASVLKGVNNDIARAVEALVRLGEGGHGSETIRTQMLQSQQAQASDWPVAPMPTQNGAGHQVQPMQPLSQQQTGRSSSTSSSTPHWNPFVAPMQQFQNSPQATPPIESAFQALNITQQQSASPHNVSSYYMQQQQQQQQPFYNTYTPPISPSPYQQQAYLQHQQNVYQQNGSASNPFLRTSRSQNFHDTTGMYSNQMPQSSINSQNPPPVPSLPSWAQPQQQHRSFSQPQLFQPQNMGLNYVDQQPAQQPVDFQQRPQQSFTLSPYRSPLVQSPLSQQTSNASEYFASQQQPQECQGQQQQQTQSFNQEAWYTNGQPQPQQPERPYQQLQANQHPYQQQPQPQQFQPATQSLQPQPTGRYDKASILSLYNNAPSQPQLQQPQRSVSTPITSINGLSQTHQPRPAQYMPQPQQQHPQQTQPSPLHQQPPPQPQPQPQQQQPWNPFHPTPPTNNPAPQRPTLGHIREESRDFIYGSNGAGGTSTNGGRHSPDAFSGLSARLR